MPLEETAGALIARVLVDKRIPAVIDTSSFSKAGARRFLTAFVTEVYHRNRQPVHVIFDEADELAPQRPGADGLKLLGCTLVTQRPAVLHKDVLTQAEVLVAMGMTGPRDVNAIDEWVKLHADEDIAKQVRGILASLPVGTAWVWSPEWLGILQKVAIRARRTFDSSATPKVGQALIVPRKRASIDLEALGAEIAATAEQKKADDPRELRRQIAALEKAMDKQTASKAVAVEVRVEVPVFSPAELKALSIMGERFGTDFDKLLDLAGQIATAVQVALEIATVPSPVAKPRPTVRAAVQPVLPAPRMPAPTAYDEDGTIHLRAGAQRMVEALGRMAPLRLTKGQWGTVARLKTSGGTWTAYMGDIRRAGFLDENSIGYTLTPGGFRHIGALPDPMTAAELQSHYLNILRAGASKMLSVLIETYPRALTKEELGDAADIVVTGGTFTAYLGDLTRNGLAAKRDGAYVATEILMFGAEAQQ